MKKMRKIFNLGEVAHGGHAQHVDKHTSKYVAQVDQVGLPPCQLHCTKSASSHGRMDESLLNARVERRKQVLRRPRLSR